MKDFTTLLNMERMLRHTRRVCEELLAQSEQRNAPDMTDYIQFLRDAHGDMLDTLGSLKQARAAERALRRRF